MIRRRVLLVVGAALEAAVAGAGCGPQIDLGSSIIWSARHETGDLNEWTAGQKGGSEADAPDATVTVSTDFAHTGQYAAKLSNVAVGAYKAARLWRQQDFPTEAYYSAWFYLASSYQTVSDWTILQLRYPTDTDPTVKSQFLDVDIRSLPSGDLILSVYDHRAQYLRSPTPVPPQFVPVGRWFQVEIFFRNTADDSGRFTLWLDGQVSYDLARPMGISPTVYWTPCNVSADLSPAASDVYVDDVAVSLVRVTPHGSL